MFDYKVYAVDFDNTLCEFAWPKIGKPKKEVIDYCKQLRQDGHKLILWTCREGDMLYKAMVYCRNLGLIFDAYNRNVPERTMAYGNDCRKVGADFYIDDKNLFMEGVNQWQS